MGDSLHGGEAELAEGDGGDRVSLGDVAAGRHG